MGKISAPYYQPMLHGRHDRNVIDRALSSAPGHRQPRPRMLARSGVQTNISTRRSILVVVFDLVEERIAQAVGVGVPLPRPLVGGKRRRPDLVGAVIAMHRQVEAIAEEEL